MTVDSARQKTQRSEWATITSIIAGSRHPSLDDYDRDAHAWKPGYVRLQDGYRIGVGAVRALHVGPEPGVGVPVDRDVIPDPLEEWERERQRDPHEQPGGSRPPRGGDAATRPGPGARFQLPEEIVAFHWSLHDDAGERVDRRRIRPQGMPPQNAVGAFLTAPAPGKYEVRLEVETETGNLTGSKAFELRDQLVVSLGDSYASGEGSPDEPGNLVRPSRPPTWLEPEANRSLRAAPALASRRAEGSLGPGHLVTFLSFASSGAEIEAGLLSGQHSWQRQGQIAEARRTVGDRHIDVVLLSIGGNDVGFARRLMQLTFAITQDEDAAIRKTREAINELGDWYAKVATELRSLNPGKVLICEYPMGLFDDDNGTANGDCGVFHLDPLTRSIGHVPLLGDSLNKVIRRLGLETSFGISPRKAEHIKTLGTLLNKTIRRAAQDHGWTVVKGIPEAFTGHGYCSSDRYFVTLSESIDTQSRSVTKLDHRGTMHPNPKGQVQMSLPIASALQEALADGPGEPPARGPVVRDHRQEDARSRPSRDGQSRRAARVDVTEPTGPRERHRDSAPPVRERRR